EKFGPELEKSERIAVVLNTYATALIGDGQRINSVEVFSAGTPAGSLAAPVVVAATGGLENERLLLWSNERSNGGAVPHAAALGRYWMEHNHFLVGHALLFRDDAIAWDETGEAFLTVSPEAMARREIGNFGVRVVPMPYHGAKRLVASLACVAPRLTEMMSDSIGAHLSCSAQLHLAWEQAPDPDNRVTLSATERDAADVPRIELHWKKRAFEHHTMIEAMRLLGHCFASKGIGRVRFDDWVINEDGYPAELEIAGHHHMGGTRMGSDPAVSVVDAHQRVHGMQNLYVAGSSVFTTGGQCTPTTTITALSLRLGEHLAQAIGA
nr:GMC oxidoreductase [Rhizobiaceae bacterium]